MTTDRAPNRKVYLWAAAALLAAASTAVVVAVRAEPQLGEAAQLEVGPPAPDFEAQGWLNSEPLFPDRLLGKVVVYDFWTYSCVNCVRTIPYLRSWYDRYQADGLEIIGVHSPEFEFEKDHGNVTDAVARLEVGWPVAFDDDMDIWNAFNNRYWPAKYVFDRQGRFRFFHAGEGAYDETEDVLRTLLGIDAQAPRATPPGERGDRGGEPEATDERITPETYLGTLRGDAAREGRHDYPEPREVPLHQARLAGTWEADGERVRSAGPGAAVLLAYQAKEVNLVMATSTGAPVDVVIEFDGRPLPPEYRTAHTMVDAEGRTYVRVAASDLYRLVRGPASGRHQLRLVPRIGGLEAFAFTFGV